MLIDLLLFSHCSYYLFHFSYFIYKLVWPFSHGLMFYFLGVTVQRVIKFITQRVPGSRDWIPQFFAETVRAYNPHTYKHILHLQATENNRLGELFFVQYTGSQYTHGLNTKSNRQATEPYGAEPQYKSAYGAHSERDRGYAEDLNNVLLKKL
jgi:hypothetical protein